MYASTATNIGAFNMTSGTQSSTPVTGQTRINAISINPVDGYLYWVQNDGVSSVKVYREKADGSGTPAQVGYFSGTTDSMVGGGFDASGNYYVMSEARTVFKIANIASYSGAGVMSRTTFTITSSTLSLAPLTNGDGAFDASGNMWAAVEQGTSITTKNPVLLVRVDPATGQVLSSINLKKPDGTNLIADTSPNPTTGVQGLTIDVVTGKGYIATNVVGSEGLASFDLSTGIISSPIVSTLRNDLGSCPVVPNPPSLSKSFTPASSTTAATTPALTITVGNDNKAPLYLTSALTDTFPAGMTVATGATITTTCGGTPTSTSTSVTLPANSSVPVGGCTITVSKVAVTSSGTYTNTITSNSLATSTGTYATPASATYSVAPSPQLKLTKTHSGSFTVNQAGTYTLTITNVGNLSTSGALTVKDALPAGMQFLSASSTQGSISGAPASGTTGSVSLTFTPTTPLAANGTATITVTVMPLQGGSLTNYASVEGGGDPDTGLTPGTACTPEQCASDPTTVLVPSGPAVPPGVWSGPASTCLDFSGVALSVNGAPITRTITTPESIVVSYTLDVTSNAQYATGGAVSDYNAESVLKGYTPGTWAGDRWDDYFGSSKVNAVYNNPVGRKVGYTLSAYATYNGQAIPLTLLTGSAEDDATGEYVKTTTNGTPFAVADRVVGNTYYGDVIVTGSGQTVQMRVNSVTGNFLLIATTKLDATAATPLILTSELAGNGATAQGYCVAFPFDRGDAPTTYTKAAHLQNLSFTSPLTTNTGAVGSNNLGTTTFVQSGSTSRTTTYLAGQPSSEGVERGTTATEDSDDALTLPLTTLRLSDTTYSVTLPYSTDVAATVSGWIDLNGNGTFETGERVTVNVPAGVGQATLTWTGMTVTVPNTTTYARFRISSNATEVSTPTGNSIVGEVEDYPLTVDRTARLTIIQNSMPDAAQDFVFTTTGTGLSGFTLDDDTDPALSATRTFTGLNAGTYTVTQATVAGWPLTQLTCTPSGSATIDRTSRKVTVTLTAGADVTCTFVNTQLPNVSLVKYVRNTANSGERFNTASGTGRPGDVLQYCIMFQNTGGTAANFLLVDPFPLNTGAHGSLVYSSPAGDLSTTSTSPTATALPAGATYTMTSVPQQPGSGTLVPGVQLNLGSEGLPGGSSGVICFNATIR
ncbi:DUF7933 domain-containing protein [Deinococcus ficus]|uniref:DUF7933 domain-containing protein n=1 Tax=Deinococcus ficus TaxID=317577 RepID=UPI00040ECBBD|nr:GEVED domain-containing protein [Deinococcus ficus]